MADRGGRLSIRGAWCRPRRITACGLIFRSNTRIDLVGFAAQPASMSNVAILFQPARRPISVAEAWLARAARMRRIAMTLPVSDAQVLKAYVAECEAEAERAMAAPALRVAA